MAKRPRPSESDRIIDATLELAAEGRWRGLTLGDIAEAAKLPLAEVYGLYPTKEAVLKGFARRTDRVMLEGDGPEAREGTARDRLFDVIMRRLDTLAPYREALNTIFEDESRDPVAALCRVCALRRSLACMLEAARLSASGFQGLLRVKGLGVVYLATLRIWLADESEDKAKTMAALDRYLGRLEWLAGCCSRVKREPKAA